jgi:large subunit ribosomal protein L13
MNLTRSLNHKTASNGWLLVDAKDIPLGRLSSAIAYVLRGKHKAGFTANTDTGDHVVVINAEKVALTGNKKSQMLFHWHTGFPGGIKDITAGATLSGKFPERLIERAVKRMMPKDSPLARNSLGKMFVYKGSEHPHVAQQPKVVDVKTLVAKKILNVK